jgi:hypothetical protein
MRFRTDSTSAWVGTLVCAAAAGFLGAALCALTEITDRNRTIRKARLFIWDSPFVGYVRRQRPPDIFLWTWSEMLERKPGSMLKTAGHARLAVYQEECL